MLNEEDEFQSRTRNRDRFYSSMNYQEYSQLFGPNAPLVKPQEDPTQDLPPLELELIEPEVQTIENQIARQDSSFLANQLDTILEIDGSQNQTQRVNGSPHLNVLTNMFSKQKQHFFSSKNEEMDENSPKRIRMRSQSDSSEYLIFNFLERANKIGRKKLKYQ